MLTPDELAQAVDDVLEHIEFAQPVTPDDMLAVRDVLRTAITEDARLDVYHTNTYVMIDVRTPDGKCITRKILVSPCGPESRANRR